MRFPIPYVPSLNYRGGRGFGANRDKVRPGLRHGACDLIAPPGTPVLAMDDGVVLRGPYEFFLGTKAIEVQHGLFIARYCEISQNTEVGVGSTVKEGQVIAYVGNQPGADMLHLELFSGTAHGDLTQGPLPYNRRSDLMDPTPVLDQLTHTVGNVEGEKFKYWHDDDGAKFLLANKKYLIDI